MVVTEIKCLSEEVGDVQAMINLLQAEGIIDLNVANEKNSKRNKNEVTT